MDFSWSEDERCKYEGVVAFAESELAEDVVSQDQLASFPLELWQRCAEFGVQRWTAPSAFGGLGYSVSTTTYLMEALGYGCRDNGLTFALGAQMWSVQMALIHFGNESQIKKYLPPMLSGQSLAAYAITETHSGSDAFSLQVTADRDNQDYVLNGEKVLVTMAPVADFALVFAVTNPTAGRWGLSAFLVDADNPGFTAHDNELKMGLRTVPFGRITLDQCRVPADALLGKEGAGASIFSYSQSWERSLVLAPQIGAMQKMMEQCIDFAKSRRRGGQPIGKNQAVSHRIADMSIRLETSRLLLYKTAWQLENGKQSLLEAAITKTYLSEAFVESSKEAILLHGGLGYTTDAGIERNLRDAIGGIIYGGTVDVQRNIIAGLLGL